MYTYVFIHTYHCHINLCVHTGMDGFTAEELLKENPGLTYDDFLLLPGHIYFSPADVCLYLSRTRTRALSLSLFLSHIHTHEHTSTHENTTTQPHTHKHNHAHTRIQTRTHTHTYTGDFLLISGHIYFSPADV